VGVIDGHLQLMSLHKGLPSWDAFLQYLFVKPVLQLFKAGCPRVVLCFDCYDYVPAYKAMTQLKRVHHHTTDKPVCTFNPDDGLPASIPEVPPPLVHTLRKTDVKKRTRAGSHALSYEPRLQGQAGGNDLRARAAPPSDANASQGLRVHH
jgi:hypothetical protein